MVTSVKLLKESKDGLALVEGADPSWWMTSDLMRGFPSPAQVRAWWRNSSKPTNQTNQPIEPSEEGEKPHAYAENPDWSSTNQTPITPPEDRDPPEGPNHDWSLIGQTPINENGIDKAKTGSEIARDWLIALIGNYPPDEGEDPGVRI